MERKLVKVTSLGHEFSVLDPSTYEYGSYEYTDELYLKGLYWTDIKPGETIVDVGASWGGWTMPALAQGANVFAFEPAQHALDVLWAGVKANDWVGRCTAVHALVGDGQPMTEWFRREIFRSFRIDASTTLRLDDVFIARQLEGEPDVCRVDRLKCDVEGMELQVLRGAERILRRWHPMLLIEDHTSPEPERGLQDINRDVTQMLRDCGYVDVETVQPPTGNQFVLAGHKVKGGSAA